jgi:hypothetical protein
MERLSEYFNKAGAQSQKLATDKWFIGTAAVFGTIALPFNTTAALICLSVPSAYYGLGMATRAIGAAISSSFPSSPRPN